MIDLPAGPSVLVLSTYDLGRQPVAVATFAARARAAGFVVEVGDLSIEPLDEDAVRNAAIVVWSIPMLTATRLAFEVISRVRGLNPNAALAAFGLYATLNESELHRLGVRAMLGTDGVAVLRALLHVGQTTPAADERPVAVAAPDPPFRSLDRSRLVAGRSGNLPPVGARDGGDHPLPDRRGLPPLSRYAHLVMPDGERRVVGATESSSGCRHRCRHCPVVPVYGGRFRAIPLSTVMADVAQLVEAGAQHLTFGDPDFLNGPAHARRVVAAVHRAFPALSFDITAKIEHLRRDLGLLGELRDAGCVLITSAVESFEPLVLQRLDKGHTDRDVTVVVDACRAYGIGLHPTFVAFTPWTTSVGYRRFLERIEELGLIEAVAPIQYTIRLLVTARSGLLDLVDVAALVGTFDPAQLCYPWAHPDPGLDALHRVVSDVVRAGAGDALGPAARRRIHADIQRIASDPPSGRSAVDSIEPQGSRSMRIAVDAGPQPATIPYLTEPWFC